jgi:hypothetical protein
MLSCILTPFQNRGLAPGGNCNQPERAGVRFILTVAKLLLFFGCSFFDGLQIIG